MSFFETLPVDLQDSLRTIGSTREFETGATIIHSGSVGNTLYVLLLGSLKVELLEQVIHLAVGDVVGEMAFLDNRPRTATVRANTNCSLLVLEREPTFRELSAQPLLLNTLIEALMDQQYARLTTEAVKDKQTPIEYVEGLAVQAIEHRAVRHPYLTALGSGELPDMHFALADFAQHYYGYSAHFPRYLTALISRLETPDHRNALLENLTEEAGEYGQEELDELREYGVQPEWIVGIPHPELFKRFRDALDVTNTAFADDHIEVVCWRELFITMLTSGSPAEAVGALGLGTETIVQSIYEPFVDAIDHIETLSARDSVFFPLHTAVDDHHQATLKAIAAAFADTPPGRADLAKGMHKALTLRDSVWNWFYQRALDPQQARS